MDNFLKGIGTVVLAMAVAGLFTMLSGALGMWTWNYAAVPVFGVPRVTFMQGWALMYFVSLVGAAFNVRPDVHGK